MEEYSVISIIRRDKKSYHGLKKESDQKKIYKIFEIALDVIHNKCIMCRKKLTKKGKETYFILGHTESPMNLKIMYSKIMQKYGWGLDDIFGIMAGRGRETHFYFRSCNEELTRKIIQRLYRDIEYTIREEKIKKYKVIV